MAIAIREERGVPILTPEGDLVMEELSNFQRSLDQVIERGSQVLLDCSKVHYLSAQAMSIIVRGATQLRRRHGDLKLVNLQEPIDELFNLLDLRRVIGIFSSISDALDSSQAGIGVLEKGMLLEPC